MGVVIISTIVFVLSTMPELTDDLDRLLYKNANETAATSDAEEAIENTKETENVDRWENVSTYYTKSTSSSFSTLLLGNISLEYHRPCNHGVLHDRLTE